MIINSVAGHELVIRPPIATLCGHPNREVIGEPINGQSDCAKQFDIL